MKVPKKLPPADMSELLPEGEAHTTLFNPDMDSPRAELGNFFVQTWLIRLHDSSFFSLIWSFMRLGCIKKKK